MPPQAEMKSPDSMFFSAGGAGEWSLAIKLMVPWSTPCQSASRCRGERIGGAHLKAVARLGISVRRERQIVRTRFGGQTNASRLRPRHFLDTFGRRHMHDVCGDMILVRPDSAMVRIAATSASAGRVARNVAYERESPWAGRTSDGSSAWTSSGAGRRRLREAGQRATEIGFRRHDANSSTPEGVMKHLNPRTPAASERLDLVVIAGNDPAPESDIDVALPTRRVTLGIQAH